MTVRLPFCWIPKRSVKTEPVKHPAQRRTDLWLFYARNYSLNLCFANKYLYLYYSTPMPAFQGICAFFLHFAGVCSRCMILADDVIWMHRGFHGTLRSYQYNRQFPVYRSPVSDDSSGNRPIFCLYNSYNNLHAAYPVSGSDPWLCFP